jgi:hypothetical protein
MLKYSQTSLSAEENNKYVQLGHEFLCTNFRQIEINDKDFIKLPTAPIRAIIWETNEPIEKISIGNSSNNSLYTIDKYDFQHGIAQDLKINSLKGNCGFIKFSKGGIIDSQPTGALASNGGYLVKFPKKINGRIIIVFHNVLRVMSGLSAFAYLNFE